jgi:hypothetical protein
LSIPVNGTLLVSALNNSYVAQLVIISPPVNGTLNVANGSSVPLNSTLIYTPVPYQFGAPFDSFKVYGQTTDGSFKTLVCTIHVNINFRNQPPVLNFDRASPYSVYYPYPGWPLNLYLTEHVPSSIHTELFSLQMSCSGFGSALALNTALSDQLSYGIGHPSGAQILIYAQGSQDLMIGVLQNLSYVCTAENTGICTFVVNDNYPGDPLSASATMTFDCVYNENSPYVPANETVSSLASNTSVVIAVYIVVGVIGLCLLCCLIYFLRDVSYCLCCCCLCDDSEKEKDKEKPKDKPNKKNKIDVKPKTTTKTNTSVPSTKKPLIIRP